MTELGKILWCTCRPDEAKETVNSVFIRGCISNTKSSRSCSFSLYPFFFWQQTGGLHRHRCLASGFKCAHLFTSEWAAHPSELDL